MTQQQWIITGAVLLAAVVLLIALLVGRTLYYRKKGWEGWRKLYKVLKRFAGIRRFKVLTGLKLPGKNGLVPVDFVLIGFFGAMVLTEKNAPGNIYGTGLDKKWVRVVTKHEVEKRGSFVNPVQINQQSLEAVREVLTAQKIYKTALENYVIFTNRKAVLNTERGLPVLTLKQFKKLLKREKYSADGPVDVDKVAEVLQKASRG